MTGLRHERAGIKQNERENKASDAPSLKTKNKIFTG